MNDPVRRIGLLRRLALICALLMLLVTSLSAFIRLSRAGLGCEPWPQCYASFLLQRQGGEALPSSEVAAVVTARAIHRVAAVSVLVIVVVMLAVAAGRRPVLRRETRLALALFALVIFLAVLGVAGAHSPLAAVTLGHLLAGFSMIAIAWRMVASPSGPVPQAGSAPIAWTWIAMALVAVQIALGGLVSAGHAGLSCPEMSGCDLSAASWQALDPWRAPPLDARWTANAAGAGVHLLHRGMGVLSVALLVPIGLAAWRRGHRAGWVVLVLVVAQAMLGMSLAPAGLPLSSTLVHNILAALLLAALAWLASPAGVRPMRPA